MSRWVSDKNPNFGTLIALLGALSVLNSALAVIYRDTHVGNIAALMNYVLVVFFIINFIYRALTSTSVSEYFIKNFGWLDLLCIIPFYQISWIFRGTRSLMTFKHLGWNKLRRNIHNEGAEAILFIGVFIILLIIEFGSIAAYSFETADPDANIQTPEDALWWSIVTISTVGYGDFYPVTSGGRLTAVVMMVSGIGIFAALTGYLANMYLARSNIRKMKNDEISVLQKLEEELKEERDKAYRDVSERLKRIEEIFNSLNRK